MHLAMCQFLNSDGSIGRIGNDAALMIADVARAPGHDFKSPATVSLQIA